MREALTVMVRGEQALPLAPLHLSTNCEDVFFDDLTGRRTRRPLYARDGRCVKVRASG